VAVAGGIANYELGITNWQRKRQAGRAGAANYRTLMAAGRHFQDRYNYGLQRLQRCVSPYATPAGLVPFRVHNAGPNYHPLIEKLFACGKIEV